MVAVPIGARGLGLGTMLLLAGSAVVVEVVGASLAHLCGSCSLQYSVGAVMAGPLQFVSAACELCRWGSHSCLPF